MNSKRFILYLFVVQLLEAFEYEIFVHLRQVFFIVWKLSKSWPVCRRFRWIWWIASAGGDWSLVRKARRYGGCILSTGNAIKVALLLKRVTHNIIQTSANRFGRFVCMETCWEKSEKFSVNTGNKHKHASPADENRRIPFLQFWSTPFPTILAKNDGIVILDAYTVKANLHGDSST